MVLGKVVQVAMDGVSRDLTVRVQALLHGVEGVFAEAMADSCKEIGIETQTAMSGSVKARATHRRQ